MMSARGLRIVQNELLGQFDILYKNMNKHSKINLLDLIKVIFLISEIDLKVKYDIHTNNIVIIHIIKKEKKIDLHVEIEK